MPRSAPLGLRRSRVRLRHTRDCDGPCCFPVRCAWTPPMRAIVPRDAVGSTALTRFLSVSVHANGFTPSWAKANQAVAPTWARLSYFHGMSVPETVKPVVTPFRSAAAMLPSRFAE